MALANSLADLGDASPAHWDFKQEKIPEPFRLDRGRRAVAQIIQGNVGKDNLVMLGIDAAMSASQGKPVVAEYPGYMIDRLINLT
jgi:hypothetical protein